jgi:hypothetical protein
MRLAASATPENVARVARELLRGGYYYEYSEQLANIVIHDARATRKLVEAVAAHGT